MSVLRGPDTDQAARHVMMSAASSTVRLQPPEPLTRAAECSNQVDLCQSSGPDDEDQAKGQGRSVCDGFATLTRRLLTRGLVATSTTQDQNPGSGLKGTKVDKRPARIERLRKCRCLVLYA